MSSVNWPRSNFVVRNTARRLSDACLLFIALRYVFDVSAMCVNIFGIGDGVAKQFHFCHLVFVFELVFVHVTFHM